MSTNLIELSNVAKNYNDGGCLVSVLKDISLSVKEGESISIMGPSGSGKTTLLQVIALMTSQDSGVYKVNGIESGTINNNTKNELNRKFFGFIYQSHNILDEFTAIENVAIPSMINGDLKKVAEAKAKEILSKLGLEDCFFKKTYQMSGGQKQRVGIARALINNPKLIIADEPTGNLDTASAIKTIEYLLWITKQKLSSLILVTHNSEIAKMTDLSYKIQNGSLVQS